MVAALPAAADPGDLDQSFGTGGVQTVDFAGTSAGTEDVAILPNGKLILVGSADGEFALARLTAGGQPDAGFGTGGSEAVDVFNGFASGVAVQSDGKLVVTGSNASPIGDQLVLARFLPNGKLDHTFSGDGKLQLHFGFGDVHGSAVAIQSDGRIVVAGSADETDPSTPGEMAVFRFKPNGALDHSFNLDGSKIVPFGFPGGGFASDLAIQGDGKIVVAGTAAAAAGGLAIAAARLLPNGKLDPGFGDGGRAFVNPTADDDFGTDVAIASSGRIVITGLVGFLTGHQQTVTVRLTASGVADHTFSDDGVDVFQPPTGTSQGQAVALQEDGKAIVAVTESNGHVDVLRYTRGGVLDAGFGTNGDATLEPAATSDRAGDVAIQGDGKIVVVGARTVSGDQRFLAARMVAT